jgi:hypothetical protein
VHRWRPQLKFSQFAWRDRHRTTATPVSAAT